MADAPAPPLTPSAHVVTDEPRRARMLELYFRLWGAQPSRGRDGALRNPCPCPMTLSRDGIVMLSEGEYVVAEKSRGVRYQLLLGTLGEGEERESFAVMVDRKLRLFEVQVLALEHYFIGGSLFDGELVWTLPPERSAADDDAAAEPMDTEGAEDGDEKEAEEPVVRMRQLFLVFDAVAVSGDRRVSREDYVRRHALLVSLFNKHATPPMGRIDSTLDDYTARESAADGKIICTVSPHGMTFAAKHCSPQRDINVVWYNAQHRQSHGCDGLIFTPVHCGVKTGLHASQFKWKPPAENTLDFILRVSLDGSLTKTTLLVGDKGGRLVSVAEPRVTLRRGARAKRITLSLDEDDSRSAELVRSLARYCRDRGKSSARCVVECRVLDVDAFVSGVNSAAPPVLHAPLAVECVRRDKTHGNSLITVQSTLACLAENITLDDITAAWGEVVGGHFTQ
jgi:hypothetical protein